jgi:hypothetical protein
VNKHKKYTKTVLKAITSWNQCGISSVSVFDTSENICYWANQMKEAQIGWACVTHDRKSCVQSCTWKRVYETNIGLGLDERMILMCVLHKHYIN